MEYLCTKNIILPGKFLYILRLHKVSKLGFQSPYNFNSTSSTVSFANFNYKNLMIHMTNRLTLTDLLLKLFCLAFGFLECTFRQEGMPSEQPSNARMYSLVQVQADEGDFSESDLWVLYSHVGSHCTRNKQMTGKLMNNSIDFFSINQTQACTSKF